MMKHNCQKKQKPLLQASEEKKAILPDLYTFIFMLIVLFVLLIHND